MTDEDEINQETGPEAIESSVEELRADFDKLNALDLGLEGVTDLIRSAGAESMLAAHNVLKQLPGVGVGGLITQVSRRIFESASRVNNGPNKDALALQLESCRVAESGDTPMFYPEQLAGTACRIAREAPIDLDTQDDMINLAHSGLDMVEAVVTEGVVENPSVLNAKAAASLQTLRNNLELPG